MKGMLCSSSSTTFCQPGSNYSDLTSAECQCVKGDGFEDVEHLFAGCERTQVAWAWCRRKIMHLMPDSPTLPSNFELLNLAYDSPMDDEICWLVTQYCCYMYEQKKLRAHNYVINVDKQ